MPSVFDITVLNDKPTLDAQGRAEISFNVRAGQPMQGRAKIVGDGPGQCTVSGDLERPFPKKDSLQQYSVTLTVPPGSTAGKYKFHLLMMNVANPDEEYSESPTVGYEVKPAPTPPRPIQIPVWVYIVAGVAVLALIVGLTYALWPEGKVPKVVDLQVEAAVAQLKKKGLEAEIQSVQSDRAPDTVIIQNPEAGAKMPADGKVTLSVAAAVTAVFTPVPKVIGMTRADAEKLLKSQGFRIDRFVPDIQGVVFDQNPTGGTMVVPSTTRFILSVK